jgi:hypothetical protein
LFRFTLEFVTEENVNRRLYRGAYPVQWLLLLALTACGNFFGGAPPPTTTRQIIYDGAVTLNIKAGEALTGTNLLYQGKAPDGRAIMSINGLQALKSTADSVKWTGALILFSAVDLNLRVVSYDESSINLAGTVHIVVQEPNPTAADPSATLLGSFTFPITYTVSRNATIPGTTIAYVGAKTGSAEFSNLDQIPYRERFDSVIWQGRLRERIAVRLDLRVLDFNEERVVLGGTARIMFEQ